MFCSCTLVYTQETVTTYTIWDKVLNVDVTEPEDSTYSIYIDGMPLDAIVDRGGLIIKTKELTKFIECIVKGKNKYIEWTNTAKENNITDLTKDIDVGRMPKLGGYFKYSDWEFDFNVKPYVKYMISQNEDGKTQYAFLIYTGKLTSSSNQYIDSDSFVYAFYSLEEIEDFISLFDSSLVYKYFDNKKNKKDLFK